jgi:hypothetical protein
LTIFLHLNRDWSPRFSTLRDKTAEFEPKRPEIEPGVSRNRFGDFLADPDSRNFSRFGAIIMQFAVAFFGAVVSQLSHFKIKKRSSFAKTGSGQTHNSQAKLKTKWCASNFSLQVRSI